MGVGNLTVPVKDLRSYNDFFASVRSFLDLKRSKGIDADVVVLTRIELILSVDGSECAQLLDSFNCTGNRDTVYSLVLDFFDRSRIIDYLERHLEADGVAEIIHEVDRDRDLIETLRRPLLLKIFCELAIEEGGGQAELIKLAHTPAALIDKYVSIADKTGTRNQESAISDAMWNLEILAKKALGLYRSARDDFDRADIREICGLSEDSSTVDEFHSILKCPFLQRWNEEQAVFSHRLFLEFFVAKGMADKAEGVDIRHVADFNELVLNVDMRQILRYFVNNRERDPAVKQDTVFHEKTKYSYGLLEESAEDWYWPEPPLDQEKWEELDRIRRVLLDAMTFPLREQHRSDFLTAIYDLFEEEDNPPASCSPRASPPPDLDPRYLMFCYESVATYLAYNRTDQESKACKAVFVGRVLQRLRRVAKNLDDCISDDRAVIRRNQLLLERLVSIAFRLGFGLSRLEADLTERIKRLVDAESWDDDSQSRLKHYFKEP